MTGFDGPQMYDLRRFHGALPNRKYVIDLVAGTDAGLAILDQHLILHAIERSHVEADVAPRIAKLLFQPGRSCNPFVK